MRKDKLVYTYVTEPQYTLLKTDHAISYLGTEPGQLVLGITPKKQLYIDNDSKYPLEFKSIAHHLDGRYSIMMPPGSKLRLYKANQGWAIL
jgi:hypothetical protein